jgi:hypothetical protein
MLKHTEQASSTPPAEQNQPKQRYSTREGPVVRIRLPPPRSLSHQCLPWLRAQRPGFRRECEPGRDQRTRRTGYEPAHRGCFSLTGIDALPLGKSKRSTRRAQALAWTRFCRGSFFSAPAGRADSVQSSGRSSSVRRVAVSSTGCRPCSITWTSSGLKRARRFPGPAAASLGRNPFLPA